MQAFKSNLLTNNLGHVSAKNLNIRGAEKMLRQVKSYLKPLHPWETHISALLALSSNSVFGGNTC